MTVIAPFIRDVPKSKGARKKETLSDKIVLKDILGGGYDIPFLKPEDVREAIIKDSELIAEFHAGTLTAKELAQERLDLFGDKLI